MEAELKLAQQRDAQERVWQQQQDKEQVRALYACLLSGVQHAHDVCHVTRYPNPDRLLARCQEAVLCPSHLPPPLTIAILLLLLVSSLPSPCIIADLSVLHASWFVLQSATCWIPS